MNTDKLKAILLETGWKCSHIGTTNEIWLGKWMSLHTSFSRAIEKGFGQHRVAWAKTHPEYCQQHYGSLTCAKCSKEAKYDKPELLCEEHWTEWAND